MSVINLNSSSFENEVLKSDKKVLVDFYADWCGPCRMVSPIVEQIADEHPEYKVCKVNVDEQPELAASFQVMNIPQTSRMMAALLIYAPTRENVNAAIFLLPSKVGTLMATTL